MNPLIVTSSNSSGLSLLEVCSSCADESNGPTTNYGYSNDNNNIDDDIDVEMDSKSINIGSGDDINYYDDNNDDNGCENYNSNSSGFSDDSIHRPEKTTTKSNNNKDNNSESASSKNDATTTKNDTNDLAIMKIGTNETKNVLCLRLIVVTVLVISCIIVACSIFFYTQNTEQTTFQLQYQQNVHKVFESIGMNFDKTFASIDSLAVNMISHVSSTNQTWPYITVSDFALRASKTRSISLGIFIETAIIVQSEQRLEWEDYAWEHKSWINDTLEIEQTDPHYYGPAYWNTTATPSIYSDYGPIPYNNSNETDRRYMPSWYMYPAVPIWDQVYNWDWLSDENLPEATIKVIDQQHAIITEPYMLWEDLTDPVEAELKDILVGWFELFISPNDEPNEPMSDIMYPVINALDRVRISDHTTEDPKDEGVDVDHDNKATVVAGIRTPFYWRDVIKFILPIGNDGLVVVFHNPCTSSFTYQINGPDTVYLGQGDLHDPQYNDMKSNSILFDLNSFSVNQTVYTGPIIDKEYCPMTITMYPSNAMKEQYCTNNPIIFTLAAIASFAFTSIVFFVYDSSVQRRQKVVMKSAIKSTSILSSLLPNHIRDRLMEEQETDDDKDVPLTPRTPTKSSIRISANGTFQQQQRRSSMGLANNPERNQRRSSMGLFNQERNRNDTTPANPNDNYGIKSFLDVQGNPTVLLDVCEETDRLIIPDPIAEMYNDTTVLFAYIDGFEKWSSNRDAKQIFILLEVLFGSFDALAKRKHVLNIESISDAYVAVTGIPEYQKGHALIMSRFADSIIEQTQRVTQKLIAALGHDTTTLQLCVGLCTGPTCAGILRSAKSRFQLYGDTICTAQQLASTSQPGTIHCCPATATGIEEDGKRHWLTLCDTITTNGTVSYLVQPTNRTNGTTSSNDSKRTSPFVSNHSSNHGSSFNHHQSQNLSSLSSSSPGPVGAKTKRNRKPPTTTTTNHSSHTNLHPSPPELPLVPNIVSPEKRNTCHNQTSNNNNNNNNGKAPVANDQDGQLSRTPLATKSNKTIRPEVTRPQQRQNSICSNSVISATDGSYYSQNNFNESFTSLHSMHSRTAAATTTNTTTNDIVAQQKQLLLALMKKKIDNVLLMDYEDRHHHHQQQQQQQASLYETSFVPPHCQDQFHNNVANGDRNTFEHHPHNHPNISNNYNINNNANGTLDTLYSPPVPCGSGGGGGVLEDVEAPISPLKQPKRYIQKLFHYSSPKRKSRNDTMNNGVDLFTKQKQQQGNVVVTEAEETGASMEPNQDEPSKEHTIHFLTEESLRNWLYEEIKKHEEHQQSIYVDEK